MRPAVLITEEGRLVGTSAAQLHGIPGPTERAHAGWVQLRRGMATTMVNINRYVYIYMDNDG